MDDELQNQEAGVEHACILSTYSSRQIGELPLNLPNAKYTVYGIDNKSLAVAHRYHLNSPFAPFSASLPFFVSSAGLSSPKPKFLNSSFAMRFLPLEYLLACRSS